jgi:hypothetical protein
MVIIKKKADPAVLLQGELDKQRRQVDVENFDITLGELVRMSDAGELIRAPEYQRKFRWQTSDESYLIESLFLGLPVPNIYVASNPDGTWEVVDGLQRLSTLLHFMSENLANYPDLHGKGPLTLTELRKLKLFNGFTFASLPTPIRLQFGKRSLRVTSLSDKSDPEIRFEVFERLNKGGVRLTPQEVRACIYRGPFAELLRELGEEPHFRSLVKLQEIHQHDGTREELVLKFFAYLERADVYDGNVTELLTTYMRDVSTKFDVAKGRALFTSVMTALHGFVNGPFLRKGYSLTPLNQFEAAAVAAGRILGAGKKLKKPKAGWLNDEKLVSFSTKGTNTRKAFAGRNSRAEALLLGQ